jgi:hypothetical protein
MGMLKPEHELLVHLVAQILGIDSRYQSSLVQEDTYLLLCQRYIEPNPVRAALVDDPAHYRWSSAARCGKVGITRVWCRVTVSPHLLPVH